MKHKLLSALLAFTLTTPVFAADSGRTVENFNFGWKFHAGDTCGAPDRSFNDSRWTPVSLPHDFQISQPWVAPAADEKADMTNSAANTRSRLSARAFKEMGAGWYRKTFRADP